MKGKQVKGGHISAAGKEKKARSTLLYREEKKVINTTKIVPKPKNTCRSDDASQESEDRWGAPRWRTRRPADASEGGDKYARSALQPTI